MPTNKGLFPRPTLVVRIDRTMVRRTVNAWRGRPLAPTAWAVSLVVHWLTIGQMDYWLRDEIASPREISRLITVSLSVPQPIAIPPEPSPPSITAAPDNQSSPLELPESAAPPLAIAPTSNMLEPAPASEPSPLVPTELASATPPTPPPPPVTLVPSAEAPPTVAVPQPDTPTSSALSPYWLTIRSNLFVHMQWPMDRTDTAMFDIRMRLHNGQPELMERANLKGPHGRAVRRAFRLATRSTGTPPENTPPEAVMTIVFSNHHERTKTQ